MAISVVVERVTAGQTVRMIDLPACPSDKSLGIFEDTAGQEPAEFSEMLAAGAKRYHGIPGRSFLSDLTGDYRQRGEAMKEETKQRISELRRAWLAGQQAAPQVSRIARMIALYCVALELAASYKILPDSCKRTWPEETCRLVFEQIIEERGGYGNNEERQAIERLNDYLTANQESFARVDRNAEPQTQTQGIRRILGYRRHEIGGEAHNIPGPLTEWLLTGPTWAEIYRGMSHSGAAAILARRGILMTPQEAGRARYQKSIRVGSANRRYYVIDQKAMNKAVDEL